MDRDIYKYCLEELLLHTQGKFFLTCSIAYSNLGASLGLYET